MSPAAIAARRARAEWASERARGAAWLREFPEINGLPHGVERHRAIQAPTLLVYGTETQEHHRAATEALAGVLPHGELVTFAGYGHDVPNAAAGQVASAVLAFLRR